MASGHSEKPARRRVTCGAASPSTVPKTTLHDPRATRIAIVYRAKPIMAVCSRIGASAPDPRWRPRRPRTHPSSRQPACQTGLLADAHRATRRLPLAAREMPVYRAGKRAAKYTHQHQDRAVRCGLVHRAVYSIPRRSSAFSYRVSRRRGNEQTFFNHAPSQINFVTVSVVYGAQVAKMHSPPAIMSCGRFRDNPCPALFHMIHQKQRKANG